MDVPGSLYLECPNCGKKQLHEVLKGSFSKKMSLNCTVKCLTCDDTRKEVIKEEKKRTVRIIISFREQSTRDTIDFPVDEELRLGDVFLYNDGDVKITGIEVKNNRVDRAVVEEITTLWVTKFDIVDMPISIKQGQTTRSLKIECEPWDEFTNGDEIVLMDETYIIEKMRVGNSNVFKPGRKAFAHEIKRMYVKSPPQKKKQWRRRR